MDWLTILFFAQPVIAILLGLCGLYFLYRWWQVSRETTIEPIIVSPIVTSYRNAKVGDVLKVKL